MIKTHLCRRENHLLFKTNSVFFEKWLVNFEKAIHRTTGFQRNHLTICKKFGGNRKITASGGVSKPHVTNTTNHQIHYGTESQELK
ncbi:MAG: hypothetical protein LBU41_02505 [Clostridiales Family XIII bacterium]|nr:hypothetical protein [Clostridiales Family XIII bacterium]